MKISTHSYKIGEVVKILKKEYSDISTSALRYWEKLNLFSPSGKTSGEHRLYTEEDIQIIRYIKELSNEGDSIKDIKDKLELWEKGGRDIEFLTKQISLIKRLKRLKKEVEELIGREPSPKLFEYIYSKQTLIELLNHPNADSLIKKAEEYKLICPNKEKKYNQMDLGIMKLIVEYNGDYLDKCSKLYDTIKYMNEVLKISLFPFFPLREAIQEFIEGKKFPEKRENKNYMFMSALTLLETIYFEDFRSKREEK